MVAASRPAGRAGRLRGPYRGGHINAGCEPTSPWTGFSFCSTVRQTSRRAQKNAMLQMFIRFLVGGAIVSLFALLGDLLHPKGFAGLFAAAPSVALATLTLTVAAEGAGYAAVEARSMVAGEVALGVYAAACVYFLGVRKTKSAPTATVLLALWASIAAALYAGVLR